MVNEYIHEEGQSTRKLKECLPPTFYKSIINIRSRLLTVFIGMII